MWCAASAGYAKTRPHCPQVRCRLPGVALMMQRILPRRNQENLQSCMRENRGAFLRREANCLLWMHMSGAGCRYLMCRQAAGRHTLPWPHVRSGWMRWLVDLKRKTSLRDTLIVFTLETGSSPLPELSRFSPFSFRGEDIVIVTQVKKT